MARQFTRIGDLVVDPFVSNGDPVYSALAAGRRFAAGYLFTQ